MRPTGNKCRASMKWPGTAKGCKTPFGGLSRSDLMSRVRDRGNETTELRMLSLLRREGVHGWRRHQKLFGKPDFVWWQERVALFVDGCFWHGHNCGRNLSPKKNEKAWEEKFCRNRLRDRSVSAHLRSLGWGVIRIWECELKERPDKCLARVSKALQRDRKSVV